MKKARTAFQEYFHDNIKQLMHVYPLDKKDKEGKLFWSLPKRPPSEALFSADDELHQDLVSAYACLFATMFKVPIPFDKPRSREAKQKIAAIASAVEVAEFKVDESQAKELEQMVEKEKGNEEEKEKEQGLPAEEPIETYEKQYAEMLTLKGSAENLLFVNEFEKDDDANYHIDFIFSLANQRALNYKLDAMDWIQVKLKAGRIVPALATTTAAIAGLQTLEMIKLLKDMKLAGLRNTFLNLAVPNMMMSEPGEAIPVKLTENLKVTLWDRWDVKGHGK